MTVTRPSALPAATIELGEAVLDEAAFAATVDLVAGGSVVALTGAGLSTDSGIPDYRGPRARDSTRVADHASAEAPSPDAGPGGRSGESPARFTTPPTPPTSHTPRPPRTPMTIAEFTSGPVAQQRYWARSHLGWRAMGSASPNRGHRALAALEDAGYLTELITQNVDGLHDRAGSRSVVDLHGRVDEVICLNCGQITPRSELQRRLEELNPEYGADLDLVSAPDGDVEFDDTSRFRVAACARCSGALKPHVVFFGDSVPKHTVQHCFSAVDQAKLLLVAGSSLTVMSGLRFVRHARRRGLPVAIINRGPTRGDDLATWRMDAGCSPTLARLAAELGA